MSFSSEVKEELAKQFSKSRHCQIAEIAAILEMEGRVITTPENAKGEGVTGTLELEIEGLELMTDNLIVLQKYAFLMRQTFSVDITRALDTESAAKVLETIKWNKRDICHWRSDGILIQKDCCKRAFIRGAFLAAGSISDPEKSYHFEIVCPAMEQAVQLQKLMMDFGTDAKIVERKSHYVVYLKEGSQIVDMLNVMEAYVSLMNLENVRIVKEMRNSVNRKVNCETANISKTVNAAVKQMDDILHIRDTIGFDKLPAHLREMALVRLEYPDAPLKELGMYLDPPVGKSGVNHRLRKLSEIAATCE